MPEIWHVQTKCTFPTQTWSLLNVSFLSKWPLYALQSQPKHYVWCTPGVSKAGTASQRECKTVHWNTGRKWNCHLCIFCYLNKIKVFNFTHLYIWHSTGDCPQPKYQTVTLESHRRQLEGSGKAPQCTRVHRVALIYSFSQSTAICLYWLKELMDTFIWL